MDKPLVSIIIPVYNGANYVGEAIDSALAQTYVNKEVIVVNDGSTDGGATERVVLSYGDKIRYYAKENGGVSTALNCAISYANGEWISWLSHDDLYTNDKVEMQMADVEKAHLEGADVTRTMFYCAGGYMDATGKRIERKRRTLKEGLHLGRDVLFEMFCGYGIGGCGLLMPKRMFAEIGGFDEHMRYMQDIFMWTKAFLAGYNFYVNHKVMSLTRIHNKQVSTTGRAYADKDRVVFGLYLAEHLGNLMTSNGKSILKQYMFLSMRRKNKIVSEVIYKKLKEENKLTVLDYVNIASSKLYGFSRRKMVQIYYKIRFGTQR